MGEVGEGSGSSWHMETGLNDVLTLFWLGCSSIFLGKPKNIKECYHFVFDKLAHILYMGWGTYS